MAAPFNWTKLEKLEASIAWRRELENAPLAHVWHLETVADLAAELRRLMLQAETDQQLISVLWRRVPGDERSRRARRPARPGDAVSRCRRPTDEV